MRLLPVSLRAVISLVGTLMIGAAILIPVVDGGSEVVAASATTTQDCSELMPQDGVVFALAPSARVLQQGIGIEILMSAVELLTGTLTLFRPRFMDVSQDELFRMALGNLATA